MLLKRTLFCVYVFTWFEVQKTHYFPHTVQQWFSNLSWGPPTTAYFVCLPHLTHLIQFISSLVESARLEMGVAYERDIQNVWCLGVPRTGLRTTAVHYCCSSMLRLSETRRFLQSSSFWEARCALIGQLSSALWLAEYLKRVMEMLHPLPCCDAATRLKQENPLQTRHLLHSVRT